MSERGDQEPGEDRSGRLLITAADVTQDPTDQAQLLPMIEPRSSRRPR